MWCACETSPAFRCPLPSLLLLPLLLSAAAPAARAGGGDDGGAPAGPSFPSGQRTRLSAALGATARLECAVLALGGCAVSWVRVRDLMILAHGGAVFASDARLDVAAATGADGVTRHQLSIADARPADTGRYECQLNTNPKRSLFFDLTIYEKKERSISTVVKGPTARSVRLGDKFTLECEALEVGDNLDSEGDMDIRWLLEDKPLTREAGGGLWLETQRWPHRAVSKLTVGQVGVLDAGRYTCAAADATAHVRVRIRTDSELTITSESTEAMQRDQEPPTSSRAGHSLSGLDLASLVLLLMSAARAAC